MESRATLRQFKKWFSAHLCPLVVGLHSLLSRRDLDHFSTDGYARNDDFLGVMKVHENDAQFFRE